MTIIAKMKQLFSKKGSNNLLSIALRQEDVIYGYFPIKSSPLFNKIPMFNNDASTAFFQLHKLSLNKSRCDLILCSKYYHIVQVDKPNLPAEELPSALKWKIQDLVPINTNDMVLDYFDAPSLAGVEKLNVICTAESKLKELVQHLHKNNLYINRIITEEFAFAGLISNTDTATLLICQQPGEDILILIVKSGQLFSYRRIRTTADIGRRNVEELSAGFIDNLSIEIQKSIDYFERQLKQSPVKHIKVLIPVENEDFIARKLSENTLLPVELLTLPADYNNERAFAITMSDMTGVSMNKNVDNVEETVS